MSQPDMILDPFSAADFDFDGAFVANLTTITIHGGAVYSVAVVQGHLHDGTPAFVSVAFRRDLGGVESRKIWPVVSPLGELVNEGTLRKFVHGLARMQCRRDADGREIGQEDGEEEATDDDPR